MSVYIDENLTGIRSLFTILTRLALWNQPSLLILDNLHRFVPAETEVRLYVCDLASMPQITEPSIQIRLDPRKYQSYSSAF